MRFARPASFLVTASFLAVFSQTTETAFACTFAVSGAPFSTTPPPAVSPSSGLSAVLAVTASDPSCPWTALASAPFIMLDAASGTGNGSVTVTIPPNTSANELQGSLAIAGQTFPVEQLAVGQAFADVSPADYYYSAVNLLQSRSITAGCNASPPLYCPLASVSRAELAIFIVRTVVGSDNFTFSQQPHFNDVAPGDFGFMWIQKLYELGITAGCGGGDYCPADPVSRDQMAIFIVRARYGATVMPDWNAAPYFFDVPPDYFAFPWIQRLYADGITAGCATNPLAYCPQSPVSRGDMAIFVMRGGFNQLLPPNAPVIASISPGVLNLGSMATFTITGGNTNFVSGITQLIFPPDSYIVPSGINVISPTTIEVNISASNTTPIGPVSIYAITGTQEAVLPNSLLLQ